MGKIVIATPFENRLAKRGTRLPELAEMLAARGHRVEYVTTDFSHAYKTHFSDKDIREQKTREPYSLIVLHAIGYRANLSLRRVLNNALMAFEYLRHLRKSLGPEDVLVLPSRPVELIYVAALVKRRTGCRVVLDIRDIWPDALVAGSAVRRWLFTAYCNFYLRRSLPFLDTFVHISPSFVGWLHRYAPGAVSAFVPPGFTGARWDRSRPRTLFTDGGIRLVYVGMLQYQIDVMPVLRALITRPHVTLTIIGDDGTGQRYPEVKEFVEKNKMTNVALVGRMAPDKVVEALAEHDIGVVPMISSSIPNKVFDYIAAYIPILSLGRNDMSNFVAANGIGWEAKFDPDSVGRVLDGLCPEKVLEKVRAVTSLRHLYERDNLYKPFIELITGNRPTGPVTDSAVD